MTGNVFTEPARTARLNAIAVARAALRADPALGSLDDPTLSLLCDVLHIFAEPEQVLDGFAIGLAMQPATPTGTT